MRKKKPVSWTAVILWFIFFWPVGIYMFYKKVKTDKESALQNSTLLKIISCIWAAIGVLLIWAEISDSTSSGYDLAVCLIVFIGGGLLLFNGSRKVKASGERYEKYIDIILNKHETSIDNIASEMSLSYGKAVKELQDIIDNGYLDDSYIDHGNHEIVLSQRYRAYEVPNETDRKRPQKIVVCKNCGGNNTVTAGSACECEFCGSPLSAD